VTSEVAFDILRDHSPHIPRRGAPQAQGPDSDAKALEEAPDTAKTESCLSTRSLSQLLHAMRLEEESTISSKVVPQSRHLYSNIGIQLLPPAI
jgi:hypothetical protein